MRRLVAVCGLLVLAAAGCLQTPQPLQQSGEEVEKDKDLGLKTIRDVATVGNLGPLHVSGVGLVTGLDKTGGGSPPSLWRKMLEDDLHKKGVENVKSLLNSDESALVLVSTIIPAGARKGDRLDIEVTLPPGSGATSLRGGYLQETALMNFDTTQHLSLNAQGGNKLIKGHTLARARGPLLVGFGSGNDPARMKSGRIWQGAVSLIDRPLHLTLNEDQKFYRVANVLADRLNLTFREDSKKRLRLLQQVADGLNEKFTPGASSPLAKAKTKETVEINLPWEYRNNPERFLRVALLVPLRETPELEIRYRRKLEEMLLDPAQTIRAALRLEALGKESIASLKNGLESKYILVRFASAEALAYLGNTAGGEELAELATAEQTAALRAYCLAALTALNEAVSNVKLEQMLSVPDASLRYGAFRALREMDPSNPRFEGELVNDAFWLHNVAHNSAPMVHVSTARRAEVVLFGEEPFLKTPVKIMAGAEFTITAEREDTRCTVSRFSLRQKTPERHQCSLRLRDVLKMIAQMGGSYADVVDLLKQANEGGQLNCPLWLDALPPAPSVEELARAGRDPSFFAEVQTPTPLRPTSGTR
jgi:flagellar basal body P-ring protein FlgI